MTNLEILQLAFEGARKKLAKSAYNVSLICDRERIDALKNSVHEYEEVEKKIDEANRTLSEE